MSESSNEIVLPQIADGEDKSSPLVNCLRNTYKHLRKWAKRFGTDAFRLYDRDISSFPVAIDFYAGKFSINYYASSKDAPEPGDALVQAVEGALKLLFQTSSENIFWRTRVRRKETRQYEKLGQSGRFFEVHEGPARFYVNLEEYLDTGLFLDHRETRKIVADLSKGKRVLNLFAYTGAFTVQAALGGAIYTKTVDMSNTYTAWAKENFILNGMALSRHTIIREDCMRFLDDEIRAGDQYDIIVIDPPTISRSKKMVGMFDVQEDYGTLIRKSLRLLKQGGVIFFSTNHRKFQFDETLFPDCKVMEISKKTHPIDFKDPKIHRCWRLSRI